MDFEVSDDQGTLRDISRSMLHASCPIELVRALAESKRDVDDKLWQLGAELGWLGMAVPEELDGAGQGIVELCLVAEELGRSVAPGPVVETALVALALSGSSSPIAAELLPGLTSGALRAGWAHHGTVTAVRRDGRQLLNGTATAVQAAAAVDWLLVTARQDDRPVLVLVPRDQVMVTRRKTLDETRGWYDVTFTDTEVLDSHVVAADEGRVGRLVDAATVLVAADALGVGERLLEMTVDYVKVREQFDRPLGSFQSVKHKVADMLTTLKGARAAVYFAAMALDSGVPEAPVATSVAKAFTSEGISELAGEALQTHGGIGFTWEHDLHLYLRRAKVDEALFGSPAEHHERVAAHLASAPGGGALAQE